MRPALLATVLLVAAACGARSMLGAELDRRLGEVDAAVTRGDTEVACARLREVGPAFSEWAVNARGERAALGNQLAERLGELQTSCSDPARLTSGWPPIYQEIRRISTYKTSWLTVFTYVSMLAVGLGAYLFLRRARPSSG